MSLHNLSLAYSDHEIESAILDGEIKVGPKFEEAQVQPASLDLSLSREVYRLKASFLPGNETVTAKLKKQSYLAFSGGHGVILDPGSVYMFRLNEELSLPVNVYALANPKSSTGRLDIFVRLVTDCGRSFDHVPFGYVGPLYLEVSSRTFPVLVREGDCLAQLRLCTTGTSVIDPKDFLPKTPVHVQLEAFDDSGIIGYRARRQSGLIDLRKINTYDIAEYWEPIKANTQGTLTLDPLEFYILCSQDRISIPREYAAEMTPIDVTKGEFRVHYAGFFDPGFGVPNPCRAVLEVRALSVPFNLEHGQQVAQLVHTKMNSKVKIFYHHEEKPSNYQGQNLRLAKQFKAV